MTTDHPTLDLQPLITPDYEPEQTIAERFALFHAANPHVADALEALARQWLAAGNARIGVKALVERLRWEAGLTTTTQSGYKLDNSLVSSYARLLIERNPSWSEHIETRTLRAA